VLPEKVAVGLVMRSGVLGPSSHTGDFGFQGIAKLFPKGNRRLVKEVPVSRA